MAENIPHYRLAERQVDDALGTLYEATDTRDGQPVLVRLLPSVRDEILEDLERDRTALVQLNHPAIDVPLEIFAHEGHTVFVRRRVPGCSLETQLRDRLDPAALLDLMVRVAEALEHAHAQNVAHLHLRASNIVVGEDGNPTLTDFGLAAVSAPEAADRDARSDLFALGSILAQAFDAVAGPSPPPAFLQEIHRIIARSTERDPGLRYQSASDLRADLKRLKRDVDAATSSELPTASGHDAGGSSRSVPAETGRLESGRKLGPYEIVDLIGEGGMGEVYRARDPRLARHVAIKIVPARVAERQMRLERFQREARAVAALAHPNILAVFDVGSDRGTSYVVTELLEGKTLKDVLFEKLPLERAVALAIETATGLAAAHDKGIVHRDIKPANIFVTDDGRLKILDFGLARFEEGSDVESSDPTHSRATIPGRAIGTAGYMAPEQVRGETADHRADIFSMGALMYEMVAGRRAFGGRTGVDRMNAVLTVEPKNVAELNPEVPPHLAQIIHRCLAKTPSERFQSARDLVFSLSSSGSSVDLSAIGRKSPAQSAPRDNPSIAVLPFVDMSPQKDQEYFCDGMAEEVLNALTKCRPLKVVARSSAFQFKGQNEDIRVIGQKLGVGTVVEGSVRAAGNRLRVTAKLVNVSDGVQLWSERFDRELDDVFAIQDEIAKQIVSGLEIKLLRKEEPSEKRRTDIRAYQHYLKARFQMSIRTTPALQQAVSHCEQAIAIDGDYAPAHACLADSLFLMGFIGGSRPADVMPRAKEAAERAIELDDTLGEAHVSLGCILATYEWNWDASGREFRRALALNPGHAMSYYWHAMWHLIPLGQFENAALAVDDARELDPLSLVLAAGRGWQLYFAGAYEDALAELNQVIERDDQFVMAHDIAAQAYGQLGRFEEAVAAAERADTMSKGRTLSLGILGHVAALAGDRTRGERARQRLLEIREQGYGSAYDMALVYTGLGDDERALEWLETACAEKNGWVVFLNVEPRFAKLRSSERFQSLVTQLGL